MIKLRRRGPNTKQRHSESYTYDIYKYTYIRMKSCGKYMHIQYACLQGKLINDTCKAHVDRPTQRDSLYCLTCSCVDDVCQMWNAQLIAYGSGYVYIVFSPLNCATSNLNQSCEKDRDQVSSFFKGGEHSVQLYWAPCLAYSPYTSVIWAGGPAQYISMLKPSENQLASPASCLMHDIQHLIISLVRCANHNVECSSKVSTPGR